MTAPAFEATNWPAILSLYDILLRVNPSPMVALNRIVVLEKVAGSAAAMAEMAAIEERRELHNHHLFYAIKAHLAISAGDLPGAIDSLQKAIDRAENRIERDFLQKKLAAVRSGE